MSQLEALYKDFFEPPPTPQNPKKRKASEPIQHPPRRSRVRFNEQVKVKNIKPQGKMRSMKELWDEEDDDDDDMGFDISNPNGDADKSSDSEGSDEALEDASIQSEFEEDTLEGGREAVARLKDDLFAEDEAEENDRAGMLKPL